VTVEDAPSDELLAARAKTGDRRSFETLVRRHKAHLYGFLRRYIGHSDDAYDVLQDCFVAAWVGLQRYDAGRPFLPWLRTIALNKARDFGRRQAVRRLVMRVFSSEQTDEPTTETSDRAREDAAAHDEQLTRLDHAIAGLPAFYKEPLLLTAVSGLSHAEAAVLLKTTPKAIEMRLARARRKLSQAVREKD
jgi:RNA polymerase sigma-70 factor (ECF subfamily)